MGGRFPVDSMFFVLIVLALPDLVVPILFFILSSSSNALSISNGSLILLICRFGLPGAKLTALLFRDIEALNLDCWYGATVTFGL